MITLSCCRPWVGNRRFKRRSRATVRRRSQCPAHGGIRARSPGALTAVPLRLGVGDRAVVVLQFFTASVIAAGAIDFGIQDDKAGPPNPEICTYSNMALLWPSGPNSR